MSEDKDHRQNPLTEQDPSHPDNPLGELGGPEPELPSKHSKPKDKTGSDISQEQLKQLLGDVGFLRTIDFVAHEAMANWSMPYDAAFRAVLSAIGHPRHLAEVFGAWTTANKALARTMLRRRLIDMFRKEAARPGHSSFRLSEVGEDVGHGLADDARGSDPLRSLHDARLIRGIRAAVASFTARGKRQQRQALLLRRRIIDGASYTELSVEFRCGTGALRVRVHKAIKALRKHIAECHPSLLTTDSTQVA
jgi:DNA-directed RNA polymerase specialized sigma24 family protein